MAADWLISALLFTEYRRPRVKMGAQESARRVTVDNTDDDTIGVVKVE